MGGREDNQNFKIFLTKDSPWSPCPFSVKRQTCLRLFPPTAEIWAATFHKWTTEKKSSSLTITQDKCDKGQNGRPQTKLFFLEPAYQAPLANCHTQDWKELNSSVQLLGAPCIPFFLLLLPIPHTSLAIIHVLIIILTICLMVSNRATANLLLLSSL